jgi:hypothetical protein
MRKSLKKMTPALLKRSVEEGPLDSGHRSREGSRQRSARSGRSQEPELLLLT